MNLEDKKDAEIETMRGMACILLVSFHVIGSNATQGMRVDENSLARFLTEIFVYLRMPLFAFISGYVYASFKISKNAFIDFYVKKLRRLGVPMLSVITLFLIGAHIVGNEYAYPLDKIYEAYLFSYAHFWYLQASLVIFLIVLIMDYFELMNTKKKAFIIFISLAGVSIFVPHLSHFFSLNGAIYIIPYFILGLYLKRYGISFNKKMVWMIFGIALIHLIIASSVSLGLNFHSYSLNIDRQSIFGISTSIFCCLCLYAIQFKNYLLDKIGHYSFTIYLYHVFFTSGWRMAASKLEINDAVMFVSSLFFGILMPIILENCIKRVRLLDFIFLGGKLKNKKL